MLAETIAHGRHHGVERLQLRAQPLVLRAMRIPSTGLDHRNARAVATAEEARGELAEACGVLTRTGVSGEAASVHRGTPERVKLRVAGIELRDAHQQIVRRLRQRGWCVRRHL